MRKLCPKLLGLDQISDRDIACHEVTDQRAAGKCFMTSGSRFTAALASSNVFGCGNNCSSSRALVLFSINLCNKLPKVYQASTLILVEPQKIPLNYVKPIVSTTIDNRIKTIQQQVTSRSRIETIINERNLFPKQRDRVPMEDLVAQVTRGIRLEVRGTSTFKIYYEDRDPAISGEAARRPLELILAIYQSAREGRDIALPL